MNLDILIIHSPILIIAIPLLAALLTPLIGMISERGRNIVVIASLAFVLLLVLLLARNIYLKGIHVYAEGAIVVDGMAIFMGIIMALVGLSAAIYSLSYIKAETRQTAFYTLFLVSVGGTFGMIFTGDMFHLFIFMEIFSISGAGLIAFRSRFADAPEGGLKYLIVSSVAALLVLFATGLFYAQYGLLSIAALAEVIQYTMLDKIALAILIAAFAMKLGSVPIHMWLPDAYTVAPSSATAILVISSHACLYAILRTVFTLYGPILDLPVVGWILIILGVLSMFIGVTMAIPQIDIKRLMSYHAISQLGYMLLGVGVGLAVLDNPEALDIYGRMAMTGGIFHILNHATYKPLLFLTAGALFYCTGTRDLNQMGGLAHMMKWTCVSYIIGALSISGIPPTNGFASKWLIYQGAYQFNPILTAIAMIVSMLTLASFVKGLHSAFMGPVLPAYQKIKEVSGPMLIGMSILALGIILFGLFAGLTIDWLVNPAVEALINREAYIQAVIGATQC